MSETYDVEQRLQNYLLRMRGHTARWAYFQKGNGPMFVYNTERLHLHDTSDPANGCFESCVFVPYGKGSKSDKGTQWRELPGSRSAHELRRDAKARAVRLYTTWLETGEIDA